MNVANGFATGTATTVGRTNAGACIWIIRRFYS